MTANFTASKWGRKSGKTLNTNRVTVPISEQRAAISQTKSSAGSWRTKRKPVKQVSDKRRKEMAIYAKRRKKFISENPDCAVYAFRSSREVHHLRGRCSDLLLNEKFWLPVSADGHRWIHNHPNEARKRGLLCQVGEWGKQE